MVKGGDYAQSQQSGSRTSLLERKSILERQRVKVNKYEAELFRQRGKRGDVGCILDDAGNGQKRKLGLNARTARSFLPDKTSAV